MLKLQTLLIILIIWLSGFALASCAKETTTLPEYTLLKDNSYEDASTEKIIWEILVSPNITKESLEILLSVLYEMAFAKTSGNNDRPVVIDIKTYASVEYATSGMGQWIGGVKKTGVETNPHYTFNETQLNRKTETPEFKFGFSQAERIRIWQDIVRAEDRAEDEALKEYPDMTPFEEFEELENEFISKYKSELAQNEGLTLEQLDEIAHEGSCKDWPFPKKGMEKFVLSDKFGVCKYVYMGHYTKEFKSSLTHAKN